MFTKENVIRATTYHLTEFGVFGSDRVRGGVFNDYSGNGISDLAMFDVNSGLWFIRTLSGEVLAWSASWGWPGAMAVGGRQ